MKRLITILILLSITVLFWNYNINTNDESTVSALTYYLDDSSGLEYCINENEEVKITRCKNSRCNVVIPSEIDGYSVTSVGNSAFEDCITLSSVTIPDSVTSIGNSAFKDCVNLTAVSIPDNVTYIGGSAFEGCINLNSVAIPGVNSIIFPERK